MVLKPIGNAVVSAVWDAIRCLARNSQEERLMCKPEPHRSPTNPIDDQPLPPLLNNVERQLARWSHPLQSPGDVPRLAAAPINPLPEGSLGNCAACSPVAQSPSRRTNATVLTLTGLSRVHAFCPLRTMIVMHGLPFEHAFSRHARSATRATGFLSPGRVGGMLPQRVQRRTDR